jgi:hypothetical protein
MKLDIRKYIYITNIDNDKYTNIISINLKVELVSTIGIPTENIIIRRIIIKIDTIHFNMNFISLNLIY